MRTSMGLGGWAVAVALAGGARADLLVNVDFHPGGAAGEYASNYVGQGALADPGHDVWNAVAPNLNNGHSESWGSLGDLADDPYVTGALVDSTGAPTLLTLSIYRGAGAAIAYNPANGGYANIADDAKALMNDFLIAYGRTTNTVVINNLTANGFYNLYLYGAGDNPDQETSFTVGATAQATLGVPGGSHNLTAGNDYVVFGAVQADLSGNLSISYHASGVSDDGDFNGFQLQAIPEPATADLLGWGVLAAAGWVQRRFRS